MPEIQSKQQYLAHIKPDCVTLAVAVRFFGHGSGLAQKLAVSVLCAGFLSGCGNKGDLYLPSDVVAVEELEDAAEKLKKRKTTTSE